MDNIGNLTAIGRGEDFVEVLECAQTELTEVDEDVDYEKMISMFICLLSIMRKINPIWI